MAFENLFDKNKKKPKQLKDIDLKEISLVVNPANKQKFLFFKNQRQSCLTDVLEAIADTEELGAVEIEKMQMAYQQLEKATEEEIDAVGTLVLSASSESPEVKVTKDGGIEMADGLAENVEIVLGNALETVAQMDSKSMAAVRTLMKLGEGIEVKWPSLTKHCSAADDEEDTAEEEFDMENWLAGDYDDDEDEPVRKEGLKWPSLQAHIPEEEEVVEKVEGCLWPTLVAQMP